MEFDGEDGVVRAQAFFKKTRKGKVIRIVEQRYMRDDANCGYLCGKELSRDDLNHIVAEAPHQQLLVVDTNVALHQLDLLEHNCPATSFIVVFQTVLEELRKLNLSAFRRLNQLMNNDTRMFIFLPNEHVAQTRIERQIDETMNDRNDRAIRTAAKWLKEQITEGELILLSNDKINRTKAQADGLVAMSMREYVSTFIEDYPELMDLLAATDEAAHADLGAENIYPEHLPVSELNAGIRSGRFFQGVLRVRLDSWYDCYVVVNVPGQQDDRTAVLIRGAQSVNRAIDGDVVVIELLPRDQWVQYSQANEEDDDVAMGADRVEQERRADEGARIAATEAAAPEDLIETAADRDEQQVVPLGRVVGVIRRNWRQYAGSLEETGDRVAPDGETTTALFIPVERRLPCVQIQTRQRESLSRMRFLVSIDSWPANSKYPLGHYVSTLGEAGDKEVETKVLLHEYKIPFEAFSAKVMACLPDEDYEINMDDAAGRRDLRHLPVVSIDPPGCKDIDDALHCIELPDGNLEIGVHIADVTHFVKAGSPLDEEAANRSTSTYLVGRRLDMLPGLLTEKLCSLKGNIDRFAFSVIWKITPQADILDVQFCKSVIHSIAALTYGDAQAMLDNPALNDQKAKSVRALNSIAKILRARRIEAGALTLASPEVRFELDRETQNPLDLQQYDLKETNALVEEFMLLANITVAKKILRHYPTLCVLRRHQAPSRSQFAGLLSAARAVGIELDIETSKRLADSLDRARLHDAHGNEVDPYFNKLIRILSTRCMMPAQYFCSGDMPQQMWHHYGLAAPIYTHFTSPIRRYADVLVHRLLAAAIGAEPLPLQMTKSKLHDVCAHMNRRHRAAQYAGRASIALHTLIFFYGRPARADAYVLSVNDEKINVLVPRYGLETTIDIRDKLHKSFPPNSYNMAYDPEAHLLTVQTRDFGTQRVRVFDKVQVLIHVEDRPNGSRALVLDLLQPGMYPPPEVAESDRKVEEQESKGKSVGKSASKGGDQPTAAAAATPVKRGRKSDGAQGGTTATKTPQTATKRRKK